MKKDMPCTSKMKSKMASKKNGKKSKSYGGKKK